jgi:hypothetical protein
VSKPEVAWTDERALRLRRDEELLTAAVRENACGDADCEGLRREAALFVLKGASTHRVYADIVQWAAQQRPVLPPGVPMNPELFASIRETFAALKPDDPLREAGLLLIEELADRDPTLAKQAGR